MSSIALISSRTQKKTLVTLFIFAALLLLLFQYRILSLLNKLGTNVTPIGTKFPIAFDFQHAPQWLLPFYYTLDYLNLVWFTTLLGLLIAGAAVTFLPDFIQTRLQGNGLRAHVAGMILGIPNLFCTCCAATTLPGLRRAGAGLGATLAFFVTAPALNIVVILLAFQLLPLKLALLRTFLGVVAAIGVTYVVARLYPSVRLESSISRCEVQEDKGIGDLFYSWVINTWENAKVAIPLLVLGILIVSVFKTVLPVETLVKNLGDGLMPTIVAAAVGTVVMVPTFTEVLWVGEFTKQGMGMGPAIALLITLPCVGLPSLWVLGRVFGSYRLATTLGIGIFVLGIISGILFATI